MTHLTEISEKIINFHTIMTGRMGIHQGRQHWTKLSQKELAEWIKKSFEGFILALREGKGQDITDQAADVANWMMIAADYAKEIIKSLDYPDFSLPGDIVEAFEEIGITPKRKEADDRIEHHHDFEKEYYVCKCGADLEERDDGTYICPLEMGGCGRLWVTPPGPAENEKGEVINGAN